MLPTVVGRPDHLWHMIPGLGYLNFPRSLLAWDMVVLNAYFALNFTPHGTNRFHERFEIGRGILTEAGVLPRG